MQYRDTVTEAAIDQGTRGEFVSRLAEVVSSAPTAHPLRVAIDGPPASGKTTLADELAVVLLLLGRADRI